MITFKWNVSLTLKIKYISQQHLILKSITEWGYLYYRKQDIMRLGESKQVITVAGLGKEQPRL